MLKKIITIRIYTTTISSFLFWGGENSVYTHKRTKARTNARTHKTHTLPVIVHTNYEHYTHTVFVGGIVRTLHVYAIVFPYKQRNRNYPNKS